LVIQQEKSQLQLELERANKELAAQCGKAVSGIAVDCCSSSPLTFKNTSNFFILHILVNPLMGTIEPQ